MEGSLGILALRTTARLLSSRTPLRFRLRISPFDFPLSRTVLGIFHPLLLSTQANIASQAVQENSINSDNFSNALESNPDAGRNGRKTPLTLDSSVEEEGSRRNQK